ncbi:MAG: hypothetical protein ACXIUW_05000 [Roseinatronobacter sp.]
MTAPLSPAQKFRVEVALSPAGGALHMTQKQALALARKWEQAEKALEASEIARDQFCRRHADLSAVAARLDAQSRKLDSRARRFRRRLPIVVTVVFALGFFAGVLI